uniref:Testis expressed 264, ER-phagy receptor n=1 Tax=Cyprinus carpio TaxID=7962 RepID=A0A8C2BUV7_CYPCA
MWEWQISSLIGFISLVLFLVAVCYILYSGLTTEVHIRTGLPPVRSITIAYKYKVGPYKKSGSLFRESCSIGPKLPCIGIFYDDPKKVPAQKCRYAVGSILSESEDAHSEEQQQLYEKLGFRIFSFPEVTHVVTASFPHRTPLSIFLGVQRVYPQLNCYIKERKLCAHPFLEIYKGGMIHYMGPLARQGDFYVPEVREAQRWLLGKESEEDRRTDITGADSDSECSSVSRLPPSESRDTSPAPSTTRMHSHGDRDRSWDFDHVERSDTSSVSSFEELDLDSDRMDRCDHTPQPITVSGKNNLQGQDREMMVEEE